jgi:protein NrfD
MDARTAEFADRDSDPIPTYYERPALKPSLYGWTVALYIFIGGLAGAAQIIATAIDLLGLPGSATLVLVGRCIALAGAIIGGILLIVDLHTKQRFYNMLRIFRATSPMSIGTYVLMSFGFWSLLAVVAQLLDWPIIALACGILASLSGWGMTSYTAALLAATATPLWAAAPRLLAVRFAGSAMATGAAALCIASLWSPAQPGLTGALSNIAGLALVVELIAAIAALVVYRRKSVSQPLESLPWGPVHLVGVLLVGLLVPIVLFAVTDIVGASDGLLPGVASACVLIGGLLMRGTILLAGNRSALRPRDYFRLAGEAVAAAR